MPGAMESVSTVNSVVRTLVLIVVASAVIVAGWTGYQNFHAGGQALEDLEQARVELKERTEKLQQLEATIAEQDNRILGLARELAEKDQEIEKLSVSLALLKVDHRLAQLHVVDQSKDETTGELTTKIRFVEVNEEGHPIDEPREFTLRGDMVYVDYLVVKFDDRYVEEADVERGSSICLFRRIFGEFQEPKDGLVLDRVGSQPKAYARGGEPSDFEKRIWADFWKIANDPERAKALGIRASHGDAVSMKVLPNRTYRLTLRASAGPTISPEPE